MRNILQRLGIKTKLESDSSEYEILAESAAAIRSLDPQAMSVEIGLRAGGGTKVILDSFVATGQTQRTHIAIDPYGNIEYETSEGLVTRHDYTNEMRNRCMVELYELLLKKEYSMNVLVFVLEDTEFFTRFADGVPVYGGKKSMLTKYALIHFDGPHAAEPLQAEFEFFQSRLIPGARLVFDDIENYDHTGFETWMMKKKDMKLIKKGSTKASYQVL